MRILLATANLEDIRWATEHGLADGIVTSPALLDAAADHEDGRELVAEICRISTVPVCVTVGALDGREVYHDARELAKLGETVVVQVPFIEDTLGAVRRLHAEGVRVAATLIFSAAQALLAAKVGASIVVAPMDQLEAHGHDGVAAVHEIRAALRDIECDLWAAFPQNAAQFTRCAIAGADAACVTPDLLRALLLHPLTDRGLDRLLSELARRPRAKVLT
jgi:transaldolase